MGGRGWIAVVGSVNADVVVDVARAPRGGETVEGRSARLHPGGKGANQAVQIARLATLVRLVARAGSDVLGDLVLESLASAGVDVSFVVRDEELGTGVASIVVDGSGENRIVVVPQANGRLSPADVAAAEAAIAGAALLLVQLEVPQPAVDHALSVAHRHGVPVLLNPAPARPLPDDVLRRVDWLVPNEHEAAALAGGARSAVDAARTLRERGARGVVVTLGAGGAIVVWGGGEEHVPAIPVERVVDTTAAGDAFCGAFAAMLAAGLSPPEAARVANAAGAVAVAREGAQPSLGDRAAIERALGEALPI